MNFAEAALWDIRKKVQKVAESTRTGDLAAAYREADELEGLVGDLKTVLNSQQHKVGAHDH